MKFIIASLLILLFVQYNNTSTPTLKDALSPRIQGGWTPINISLIPRARPDVVFLEAPVFQWKFGDLFKYLNLYHQALGFVNRRTGQSWTCEYDAHNNETFSFATAVIPDEIIEEEGKPPQLIWKNYGGVILYLGINATYWTTGRTIVGQLNGTAHNMFIEYLKSVNRTKPFYDLFNVYDSWTDRPGKLFKPSQTCADFIWDSFEILHRIGMKFNYSAKARKNYINLYSKQPPITVSFQDPTYREMIVNFYKLLSFKIDNLQPEKIAEIIGMILKEGYFFIRVKQEYRLVRLHAPYFNWKYYEVGFPGRK